jgi:hypothetical protein
MNEYRNYYRCPHDGELWEEEWSAMCNDQCPICGSKDIEPYASTALDTGEVYDHVAESWYSENNVEHPTGG